MVYIYIYGIYIYIYMTYFLSIFGQLVWFHSLTIVNSAIVNVGVQLSHFYVNLNFFICSNGMAMLSSRAVFRFLMNLHTNFYHCSASLHSHQQCMGIPFFPYPPSILWLFLFLIMANLTNTSFDLRVVLIYISYMGVEHFFMCSWSISIHSS
jgi:hypothetical protein